MINSDLIPILVSLLIGIIIGVERERSHRSAPRTAIGVRTFSLLGLIGALAGKFDGLLAIVLAVFCLVLIAISYYQTVGKNGESDYGLTTEIAAGVVFMAGYLSFHEINLSLFSGVIVFVTLAFRDRLHRFSRNEVRPGEIQALAILLLVMVLLIPNLPNSAIDTWGFVNPRKLVSILGLLLTIQFFGYLGNRIFGARAGAALTGFLGGLVSSTAVFLSIAGNKNSKKDINEAQMGILSVVASLGLLGIMISLTSVGLIKSVGIPLMASLCLALLVSLPIEYYQRKSKYKNLEFQERVDVQQNPLRFIEALKLTVFLAFLLVIIGVVKNLLGDEAMYPLAFVTGLFELHAIGIGTGTLFAEKAISEEVASRLILLAGIASLVSKSVLVFFMMRDKRGFLIFIALVAMMIPLLFQYINFLIK